MILTDDDDGHLGGLRPLDQQNNLDDDDAE